MPSGYAEARNIVFHNASRTADRLWMNKTCKTEVAEGTTIPPLLPKSVWRRLVKLFRRDHNPLLVASLTAFNERRIYLTPDFSWPLRLILSHL
jgi:hypothetical protein